MLKTIVLHGELQKFSKDPIKLDVASPVMACRALISRFGAQFEKTIREGSFFVIRGKQAGENSDYATNDNVSMKDNKDEIHFIPTVQGSSSDVRIIIGVVLLFIPGMQMYGAMLILGGIAEKLAPKPQIDNYTDANVNAKPSKIFNGTINTRTQGGPVPLLFGKFICGTTVVSAGVRSERVPV